MHSRRYTVFPFAVQVDGKWRQSINQSRGIHPKIQDRFDLTLECIRRFYLGEPSPLANALSPYNSFFQLFGSFPGYVDHFLLNDLVSDDYSSVRFWTDFDNFTTDALPAASIEKYREYMSRSMAFITARNERITRTTPVAGVADSMVDDGHVRRRAGYRHRDRDVGCLEFSTTALVIDSASHSANLAVGQPCVRTSRS